MKGKCVLKKYYLSAMFSFEWPMNLIAVFVNPFYFTRKNLYRNIKKFSGELDGRILDFGCGSKPYRSLFSHCKNYIGCDVEISGHSHNNENIDIFYNGISLPFDNESFDSIFSSQVLEHVFNIDKVLSEFKRVLLPNGKILVTVPFVWNEHEIPYDCARYTSFGLDDLFKKHGFEILEHERSGSYIETIFAMLIEYIRFELNRVVRNVYILLFFQLLIISPITLCGIIMNKIFPDNQSLYADNVVLARRC